MLGTGGNNPRPEAPPVLKRVLKVSHWLNAVLVSDPQPPTVRAPFPDFLLATPKFIIQGD